MTSSRTHAADLHDLIRVQGARAFNLKDVSVEIPKRRLTVFTGVSGSGKSSLVFGTIAAESQRLRSHSENRCRWIRRRFWHQVASDVREWDQRPMTEQKTHLETEDTRKQGMYFSNGF